MQKATATYRAPPGDSKVVEMGGVTFFDGKSVELNSVDHAGLIQKLPDNAHFDIKVEKDDGQIATVAKKRGRPSNADVAAAKEAAEKAESEAKAAAEKAKEAKADADALVKDAGKAEPKAEPAPVKPVSAQPAALGGLPPGVSGQTPPNPSFNALGQNTNRDQT